VSVALWLRDGPGREAVHPLPAGVEMHLVPRQGALPPELYEAEFLVPPYGSRRILEALPRMKALRVIQANSSGVEWLLPHVPAGVTVCNAKGTRDVVVSEWVLAAILAMTKDLPHWHRRQEAGTWEPALLNELAGSRVLIVGYGSIGRAVEERLTPFGVLVERIARRARPGVDGVDRLAEQLQSADVVVLLLPSTPATDGIFDKAMLARMKPGALLVNAGRGTAVDTDALVDAVSGGRIRAALDVTDPEPLPEDHPSGASPASCSRLTWPATARPPSGASTASSANRWRATCAASRWSTWLRYERPRVAGISTIRPVARLKIDVRIAPGSPRSSLSDRVRRRRRCPIRSRSRGRRSYHRERR
jgi:phosphoglycerate dehydrogenase-like enzyme